MTARQHPDSHGDLDFVRVGSWVLAHAAIIRPSEKAAGRVRERPANRRRRLVTRHLRRTSATAAVDSRGFEPRLRFARAACFHYTTSPTSGEGVEPSRARRPARYPPTIAAWRLAVRPAGHRKESSRCPP